MRNGFISIWKRMIGGYGKLCKELNVAFDEPAYYRDVYVWLPEQRWGNIAWPPCPTCLQQDVAAHGFQTNHFGRRVVSITSNYFIMSRRYICRRRCCQEASSAAVEKRQQRTFMGYAQSYIENPSSPWTWKAVSGISIISGGC